MPFEVPIWVPFGILSGLPVRFPPISDSGEPSFGYLLFEGTLSHLCYSGTISLAEHSPCLLAVVEVKQVLHIKSLYDRPSNWTSQHNSSRMHNFINTFRVIFPIPSARVEF